jgi:hypothetical protein
MAGADAVVIADLDFAGLRMGHPKKLLPAAGRVGNFGTHIQLEQRFAVKLGRSAGSGTFCHFRWGERPREPARL